MADMVSKGRNDRSPREKCRKAFQGEHNPKAKLTVEQVREIRRKGKTKLVSVRQLATEYQVTPTNIRDIIKGKIWSHIFDEEV